MAKIHRRTLEQSFGDEIELYCNSYEDIQGISSLEADVVVISLNLIDLNARQLLADNAWTTINSPLTQERCEQKAEPPAGMPMLLGT